MAKRVISNAQDQAPAAESQPAAPAMDSNDRLARLEAENAKLHSAIKEMLARDEERKAAEAKKIADEAARIAALPAPEWQIEVEAYNQGTYPEPGAMHAWLRHPGDRFKIKNKDHFRPEWMTMPGVEPKPLTTKTEVAGHGPGFTPGVGIPLTGVSNMVKDPMQAINDATRAASVR